MKRVLFLCTGNYYRSRFCEVFFNWIAQRQGLGWIAESRGLRLNSDNLGPISHYTVSRLKVHGIPADEHQRLPLSAAADDFATADRIIAVKKTEHGPLIESRFADWLDKVEFWEIHDLDFATPDEALPELERAVLGLVDQLKSSAA